MNLELIDKCYENQYNIDLKQVHQKNCNVDYFEQALIDEINNSNRIIFKDGLSDSFKLIIQNNLVYLVGEKSCYPCSSVVQTVMGKEFNWVKCFFVPDGKAVLGETDIRKSAVIISFYHEFIPYIKNEETLIRFINFTKKTFINCYWFKEIYSISTIIRLISFWDYKEKIQKMYEKGLLYPLELAVYNLYNKLDFKVDSFIKYFINSLAESTNKIFNYEQINYFLDSLSSSQIEELFAVDIIRQSMNIKILDDNYFADLIEVDCEKRYPCKNNYPCGLMKSRENVKELFLTSNFNKKYLKILQKNIRLVENEFRRHNGYDNVGTFFMEKMLYLKLIKAFPNLTIIRQYSPNWLSPQRIDIFIQECSLAIEYNGAQHYREISFFGGKDGLVKIQSLDKLKEEKCLLNSVELYIISHDESFDNAFSSLIETINRKMVFL